MKRSRPKLPSNRHGLGTGAEEAGGGKQRDRGDRARHEYLPCRSAAGAPAAPGWRFWSQWPETDRTGGGDGMKKLRLLLITLCVTALMGSMAVTAYAGGGEEWDGLAPVEPLPAETVDPGEGFTEDGNLVTRDLLYDEATNKPVSYTHLDVYKRQYTGRTWKAAPRTSCKPGRGRG